MNQTELYVCSDTETGREDVAEPVAHTRKTPGNESKLVDDTDIGNPLVHSASKPHTGDTSLEELGKMPIDILFEIFGCLEPLDLVHLARTTKNLRTIMVSRPSISVWRAVRANIPGLPNCPDDLSEPQYAVLAFSNTCSFCHQNVGTIHTAWSARVKCCNTCLTTNFERAWVSNWLNQRNYPSLLARWVPYVSVFQRGNGQNGGETEKVKYSFRSVDKLWRVQYKALSSPQSKDRWLRERLEERYAIVDHSRRCSMWYNYYYQRHKNPQVKDISLRQEEILEYIRGLGFKEELWKESPLLSSSRSYLRAECVKKIWRAPITDSTLAPVKDFLVGHMDRLRERRKSWELDEYLKLLKPFLSQIQSEGIQHLPVNAVYPCTSEVYTLAVEHQLIDYSKSTPLEGFQVPYRDLVGLWRAPIESQLLDLISKAFGEEQTFNPATVFDLATTVFECTSCSRGARFNFAECYGPLTMHYENAMVRACARYPPSSEEKLSSLWHAMFRVFNQVPWSNNGGTRITFNKSSWRLMADVVEMAGFDPRTTTVDQMDVLNPIFECIACHNNDKGRATMTWAAVVGHKWWSHNDTQPAMDLRILVEPELSKVRERIKEEQGRALHQKSCRLVCPYCRNILGSLASYRTHLRDKHKNTKKVRDSQLIFSPEQRRIPPVYWLWPPEEDSDEEA